MKNIRITFPAIEQRPAHGPDESRLTPRFDLEPGVSAEIAVERGVETPEEEDYVQELRDQRLLPVPTGDSIEVDAPEEGDARAYFVNNVEDPALMGENGRVTQLQGGEPAPLDNKE